MRVYSQHLGAGRRGARLDSSVEKKKHTQFERLFYSPFQVWMNSNASSELTRVTVINFDMGLWKGGGHTVSQNTLFNNIAPFARNGAKI